MAVVMRWIRRCRQRLAAEHGQAMPLVLGFMLLGALVVTPALNLAASSLDSSTSAQRESEGIYAADAGVEYVLWCLQEGTTPPAALQENINQHSVSMLTEEIGEYTLYFGEFVEMGGHNDFITVSGNTSWNATATAYNYSITISLTPEAGGTKVHLAEVGVRLPPGYDYVAASAAEFGDNLDTSEPETGSDSQGAVLLRWQFDTPKPYLQTPDSVATQVFLISGSGELDGDYTWVVANREDIGAVSDLSGTVYQVTANATHLGSGKISAQVVADVIDTGSETYLVSWSFLH
jgi:hypothetical protein